LGVDASGRGRLVAEWLDTYDLNPRSTRWTPSSRPSCFALSSRVSPPWPAA